MPRPQPVSDPAPSLTRRTEELQVLYDTIRDLSSTLSVREVLDRLLVRVLDHLSAEIGSILLKGPDDRLRIAVARGLPVEVVQHTRMSQGEGICGAVAANGESILVRDIEQDARFRRTNDTRYYTHSFISAPLLQRSQVRGVINVNNKVSREVFGPDDLKLLEAIAGTASAALANADAYERLLERAQRDSLTGLANHGCLWSSLKQELQRGTRYGHAVSLVLLDVDHFKRFNDLHGHAAGDQSLCGIARVLEANTRSHDIVARYGGEEFAVVLPETGLEGARIFAEKLRQGVEAMGGDEGCETLTLSAGVASCDPDSMTPTELVELADSRLYRAKALGRNRICADD